MLKYVFYYLSLKFHAPLTRFSDQVIARDQIYITMYSIRSAYYMYDAYGELLLSYANNNRSNVNLELAAQLINIPFTISVSGAWKEQLDKPILNQTSIKTAFRDKVKASMN